VLLSSPIRQLRIGSPRHDGGKFDCDFKVIWAVQSCTKKHSASVVGQITGLTLPVSPNEGRLAIVTNVRWDAVDADALLTNGA